MLADYAHRFGLGQKTGVIFPERSGIIPSTHWKKETLGKPWYPGETLSAIIGQSYILVTPIQVACMISSIFTSELVRPRIVATEPVNKQPLHIAQDTLEFIRSCMKQVIIQGTGKTMNNIKDIEIWGKSSTAQTSSLDKRDLGGKHLEHGWFVMHFKYKHHRPLTLVTLIGHAGSTQPAKMVAKQFIKEYKILMDS